MTSMQKILPAAGMFMLATMAAPLAASTDVGNELSTRMNTACIDASELKGAKVIWSNPYFGNEVAAIVDGTLPQKQMAGARASVLCLYDKKTGHAAVQNSMRGY